MSYSEYNENTMCSEQTVPYMVLGVQVLVTRTPSVISEWRKILLPLSRGTSPWCIWIWYVNLLPSRWLECRGFTWVNNRSQTCKEDRVALVSFWVCDPCVKRMCDSGRVVFLFRSAAISTCCSRVSVVLINTSTIQITEGSLPQWVGDLMRTQHSNASHQISPTHADIFSKATIAHQSPNAASL